MTEFLTFISGLFQNVLSMPFDLLVAICWGSFLALYLISLIACLVFKGVKQASKAPFLALVNVFTALNFAVFIGETSISTAIFFSAIFWAVGYILYGSLCLIKPKKVKPTVGLKTLSALPKTPPEQVFTPLVPSAKSNVRLEHATSIVEKLLLKNPGRGDRAELEKLRQTLSILQRKECLSPADGEILNENFNALLKLMAKYNY